MAQVYKIDEDSINDEELMIEFHSLYVESFKDLCIWKGKRIINLGEYIKPTSNLHDFIEDVKFTVKGLGIEIYYTHNDDVITSIAFIEVEPLAKCYVKLKFLCAHQHEGKTNESEPIPSSGGARGQGRQMLDFIFRIYKNYVILIEPASPELIPYYTKYNNPSFPYSPPSYLKETFGFLVYGNLSRLGEKCFSQIFRSMNTIKQMVNTLQFQSINDLYRGTNNITTLKDKLITKLDFLVKTQQMKAHYYEQILQQIIDIKFYDIEDILFISKEERRSSYTTGGKKRVKKSKVKKSQREKRKLTRKMKKSN